MMASSCSISGLNSRSSTAKRPVCTRASLMRCLSVAPTSAAETLRQRISDALVQTGRFAVLDREFSPEIEQELAIIATGQAPRAELAKLSQAASADLGWSP